MGRAAAVMTCPGIDRTRARASSRTRNPPSLPSCICRMHALPSCPPAARVRVYEARSLEQALDGPGGIQVQVSACRGGWVGGPAASRCR